MRLSLKVRPLISFITVLLPLAFAQTYQVISVSNGGKITGTVKWAGAVPRLAEFPITKDSKICDPESRKTTDLERLIIGPDGGVANTVVYLKDISAGKLLDPPDQRRHLDQQHCRYVAEVRNRRRGSNLHR